MERYRELGIKLTPQRLAILKYLEGNRNHPSAEDIFAAVSKKFPTMSFATVYNTLEALRNRGEISELTIDPGKKRFDPDSRPHHHVICLKCNCIYDVHAEYRIKPPDEIKVQFELTRMHVEFSGICLKCKSLSGKSGPRSSGVLKEAKKGRYR